MLHVYKHLISCSVLDVKLRFTCYANEFAHELGHNWAGHYPNGFNGSVHRSSEYLGSTWGWNSDYNVFLPNFQKSLTIQKPFKKLVTVRQLTIKKFVNAKDHS